MDEPMEYCRCGKREIHRGDALWINDYRHASLSYRGAAEFCGPRSAVVEAEQGAEIARLREELQRALEPWTVYVFVDESSTGGNPFASYECKTVDVGVADRHLMVECDEVQALRDRAAKLRADLSTGGKVCHWQPDAELIYHTDCGHDWQFTADGLQENEAEYCPFCGGSIEEWVALDALEGQ